jgi:hypothetical protein
MIDPEFAMADLRTRMFAALIVTVAAILPGQVSAQDVRVTVITIMADKSNTVDSKLTEVAREVKKVEPGLTGFRLGKTGHRDITVGQKEAIKLFDDKDYTTDIRLVAKDDSKKRATIEIKPPLAGAITYETTYDKFFPIVTRAVVDGERVIIGYMVKPAEKSKPAGP